jgi:hypothetical protein
VSNPYSGEFVKGHRIVLAELGLAEYRDRILRDERTLAGAWSKAARGAHIYSFSHHGQYFSGTHQKPFLSYDSAKQYVAGFPKDTRITVRVNPRDPKTSIVRDEDQDQPAMKLRARFD